LLGKKFLIKKFIFIMDEDQKYYLQHSTKTYNRLLQLQNFICFYQINNIVNLLTNIIFLTLNFKTDRL
jgi:hypothetical protein